MIEDLHWSDLLSLTVLEDALRSLNDVALVVFLNEAGAVNAISHPGVVQVSDIGNTSDGGLYLVLEYLDGQTLSERLTASGGRLSEEETITISWQLAGVLTAAHSKNIVHRVPSHGQKPSRNRDLSGARKRRGNREQSGT